MSKPIRYKPGSNYFLPKRWTLEGKLVSNLTPNDINQNEATKRTVKPQKVWFDVNKRYTGYVSDGPQLLMEHEQRQFEFLDFETKLIWKAFDTPERVTLLMADYMARGYTDAFRVEWIDAALHWVKECRYWRCIGIKNPFYDQHTLRANCWAGGGLDVGRIQMSEAMLEAVSDMERAMKRKAQGLEPNYRWDMWGPMGFIDGRQTEYLPTPITVPKIDPDGVNVEPEELAPYSSHEAIKERYAELIFADTEPYDGAFLSPSHGAVTLNDLEPRVIELFATLKPDEAERGHVDPQTLRDLLYLSADLSVLDSGAISSAKSWEDVQAVVAPLRSEHDIKVDAARLLFNTTYNKDRTRSFYEEKCGWPSYMHTNDKNITGATLALLADLRRVAADEEWGLKLCQSSLDIQREAAMGSTAFTVFRHLEDLVLENKRAAWTGRFAGEASEEKTLDYILQNMSKRSQSPLQDPGTVGEEFDRETEPIGRTVQRRVLTSDLQKPETKRFTSKPKFTNPLEALHKGQVTRGTGQYF